MNSSNTVESDAGLFCCNGCISVYELLNNLGLDDYYKIKEAQNIGKTGPPRGFEEAENYDYLNQESFVELYSDKENPLTMNFYVEGIECAACLWLIEKIPDYSQKIESLTLNMSDNTATVRFTPEKNFSSFPEIAAKFGYRAHPLRIDEEARTLKQRENRKSLIRLAVAGVSAGNIMLLSAAVYSGASGVFAENFMLLSLLLALPAVTYSAYPFYRSVISSLRMKRATVDIPIVFVILIGFLMSAYNFMRGSDQVYFDSITAFIFLLLASRYVLRSVQEKIAGREDVTNGLVSSNRILIWDDEARQYFYQPTDKLAPGQKIKIVKDGRVPVDGELLSPEAEINLSVLTGENIPQSVSRSESVFAGSMLLSDEAILKVVKTSKSTRIGKILDEVETNFRSKISFSAYSDKYATIFTAMVGIIAVASFFVVSSIYNPSEGFKRVIAFILISCPCAFVFALPLAYALSLNSAFRKGFLVKEARIYEKLPGITNIFFDKTGTLTNGVFRILKWDLSELPDEDCAAVLAIEKESSHPVARALVSHLAGRKLLLPKVSEFRHLYSRGIEARIGEHIYTLTTENDIAQDNELNEIILTRISIRKNGEKISEILMGDSLKEDAKFVVNELRHRGYNLFILSGDKEKNVKHVAENLKIREENVYWERTPEEKSAIIKSKGRSIMIGDGLNDAGALSSADIGVAIQGSVEESLKVSDAYILNNDLFTVLDLIDHASRTEKTLKTNTVFSVAYNITAGAFALTGFINPLAAAVLMPLSSVLLIASSVYGQTDLNMKTVRENQ